MNDDAAVELRWLRVEGRWRVGWRDVDGWRALMDPHGFTLDMLTAAEIEIGPVIERPPA